MKSAALLVVVLMIWGVGLLAFASRVEQSTPPQEPAAADGVVVLTGPSSRRIEAAMALLENGKARRMLISGVDREATSNDIRRISRAADRVYDCCVDLGRQAVNTIGNAREAAAWAYSRHFRKLIVVTADYHMPRSLLELHSAMPGVALTAYPVATGELHAHGWWRDRAESKRMVLEYCKYLTVLAREIFLSLGPRAHTNPEPSLALPAAQWEPPASTAPPRRAHPPKDLKP